MSRPQGRVTVIVSPVHVNGTAALRAFARMGCRTVAVSTDERAPGLRSRFAHEKVVLTDATDAPGWFARWLVSRRDLAGALVVPTGDEVLADLHANRAALDKSFNLSIPPPRACEIALDKAALYRAAGAAGIPVLRSVDAEGIAEDALGDAAGLGFPVIVKPRYAIPFQRAFSKKLVVAHSREDLRATLEECGRLALPVILQELLPASGSVASYSAYVARDGSVAGELTSRRPGIHPPDFGTGFLEVSERIGPLFKYGRRLIEAAGFSGALLNLDFKFDERDGRWKLLDMNARSWRQASLAAASGINVFEMLLRDCLGRPARPAPDMRRGRRWLYAKDALYCRRAFGGRAAPAREFLRFLAGPRAFALFDLSDPRPFVVDIAPLVMRRFRRKAPRQDAEGRPFDGPAQRRHSR